MDKLKPLVNSPHWGAFLEYMTELHDRDVSHIIFSKDDMEIHRYQGKLETYKKLLSLKEVVNQHGRTN